ncbi:peptidase U32 [Hydrocoleum sp. CS-953]|uniref:peptidase U32 family protein n=1 Tax=Hydrocoleum sp. CS-953 TaxID=1671698 RepID=UPI000B9BBC63|nr:U32 family peptidase [Hydrocoleum sp. CS-953]OZH52496.1 peptidase U32 [Hydrocoleum sp. CS-953]
MWKPELLAPAKNLERLKVAVTYGADAVYVGGQKYGLRARADNFSDYDLEYGVNFAHENHAKVYLTLNAFLHDDDFEGLAEYCQFLEYIGVDGVIVSDLGVVRVVKNSSNLDIHLSTQASCLNSYAGEMWKQFGVKRLIVGREVSVVEGGKIRGQTGIDVEMFIHGAMCMAFSGNCTISNFTAGRDSNRGGCIQSCRFPYQLAEKTDDRPVTFMSSKDLWGIHQIGAFFEHQICSLKIEGRMKSSFYVAVTCRAYRQAIDAYAEGRLTPEMLNQIVAELESIPHRDYDSASLETPAGKDSVYKQLESSRGTHEYLGIVMETTPENIVLQLVESVRVGDEIEIIPVHGEIMRWKVSELFSVVGDRLEKMRAGNVVCIPKTVAPEILNNVEKLNVVRVAPF